MLRFWPCCKTYHSQSICNRASRVVEGGTEYIVNYCHRKDGIESPIFVPTMRDPACPVGPRSYIHTVHI